MGDEVPEGTIMDVNVGETAVTLTEDAPARADDSVVAVKTCAPSDVGGG